MRLCDEFDHKCQYCWSARVTVYYITILGSARLNLATPSLLALHIHFNRCFAPFVLPFLSHQSRSCLLLVAGHYCVEVHISHSVSLYIKALSDILATVCSTTHVTTSSPKSSVKSYQSTQYFSTHQQVSVTDALEHSFHVLATSIIRLGSYASLRAI
jgi:hypothetical protein